MARIDIPTPDALSTETGKVQLTGDLGGTATSPKVPELVPNKIGALGIISHSWAAGSALSSTGTPQFEQQGPVGRLSGLMKIANENQEHLGIAGSYLARTYTAFGTQFSGWGGVYSLVYPASNSNVNDVSTTTRSVPALASPKAWAIIHGINDAAIYGGSTTTLNFTQTTLAWKHALRSTISRLRAGALYSSYLNSSGAVTWDSSIAFGGTGTWSDVASVGQNTGPAYKSNTSNGGTVTITLPTNFTGGTVAVSYIGQVYAHSLLQSVINTTVTSISIASANSVDFPASLNYVIQIDNEQMLVTGGQGTATLTVTRAVNGTTATIHNANAEVYMVSGMTVNFTGTASGSTGSLAVQAQGLGGGALGRSFIGLVKRFTMTAADAGKTIICTTASKITNDTYTAAQFDSWWIESSDPSPVAVMKLPQISMVLPYAGVSVSQWTSFNQATVDVVAEFDSAVKIADVNAAWSGRVATLRSSMTAGTTTCSITANDATAWAALGTGFVVTTDGEDMLVTANTLVSGSNFDLTVTRGYNGTTAAAHNTTGRYVSDASWMHTDNIHPNGYGHATVAKVFYDTFAQMTSLNTYQPALSNGNITQDNRLPVLGIKDNWYMVHHNNVALATGLTFTLNKLWYFPFYVPQKCILVGAGIFTGGTTAGTSTNVRVGLYDVNVDRYSPGALIKEFGTSATTALNSAREVACHQVLNPGWYFLAYVNQGTTAGTVRTMTAVGYTANIPYHFESTAAVATSFSPFFSDTGTISSTLPTTAAWQQDNGPIPFPILHFRAKHYV